MPWDDFLECDTDTINRNVGGRPAKDYKARGNRKIQCAVCSFTARTSAAQLRNVAELPTCCGEPMILPELRDRFALDPDTVWEEAQLEGMRLARERGLQGFELQQSQRAHVNRVMRECGAKHLIVAPFQRDTRAAGTPRCKGPGGCNKITNGAEYCDEHKTYGGNYAR